MTRRPYSPRRSSEARHEQLLDAALRVIDRDGYRGVSIDAVAREADVTRPVVYRIFEDLDSLLYALLDRQEERILVQLAAVVAGDEVGQEPLIDGLRRLIEAVRADPPTWRPVLLAPTGTPAAVRKRVERDREQVRVQLEAVIAGLGLPAGMDAGVVAHAALATAERFGQLILEDPEGFDPEPVMDTVRAALGTLGP